MQDVQSKTKEGDYMKYEVVVYYDNMVDSVHTFSNKNEAINELHRLRGVKYRNSRMYRVELEEVKQYDGQG